MGRHWSRTIRLLARDADWSSEGPRAIETAVLRELRRALESAAVRAVFLDPQQHLLGPGALVPRGTGNELVEMMRGHLEIRHAEGLRGGDLLRQGLGDALAEELGAKKREVLAHVLSKHARSVREMSRRFDAASAGAIDRCIDTALAHAPRVPPTRRTLELDGNLLGGIR